MNFGGVHFFAGLFYLILSILCLGFYLLVPCLLLPIIQRGVALFKRDKRSEQWPWPLFWFVLPERRRALMGGMGMISLFFGSVYLHQRLVWMGSDNANFKAKEYFVAGQPLAGLRLMLATYLNPDNLILQPLHGLQHLIYIRGIKQLPEKDGEIGVWADLWFNYPYIRKMWEPYGTDKRAPSHQMRNLLDTIWFAMEAMSTRPFADKKMEQKNYQLNFPRSAFYYTIKAGYYHDRYIGASVHLLKDLTFVERSRLLYEWTTALRERWIEQGRYESIKKEHPKVEALRQVVVLDTLENLIQSTIYSGEFSCDNPEIPLYIEARRDFADENARNHVLKQLRQKEKRQADDLYVMGVGSVAPAFLKYLLKQYCDMEVVGDRSFGYKNKEADQREVMSQIKRLFRHEIKILEEGKHE